MPSASSRRSSPEEPDSYVQQALAPEFCVVDDAQAAELLKEGTAKDVARLLVEYLQYSGASHDWLQQWEVDYFTNAVTELTGRSTALPPVPEPQNFSPAQMAMALRLMKFALSFYREAASKEEDPKKRPNAVRSLLAELEDYPSASRPLMTISQLSDIAEYLAKVFGSSFVRALLRRTLCETPYRLEWKINCPLVLREPSPEPPPPKPEKKKKARKPKPKKKKRGKECPPTPPEELTREEGVQCHPPGLLPLRLAAPFPLMYQLYTGEEYNEEEMKKKKRGGKRK